MQGYMRVQGLEPLSHVVGVSNCSSDKYFYKGVYLWKSSFNVSYAFSRVHFIN
jgi:hypothetical protein